MAQSLEQAPVTSEVVRQCPFRTRDSHVRVYSGFVNVGRAVGIVKYQQSTEPGYLTKALNDEVD